MKRSVAILLLVPVSVFAEVSDKMATQSELWITGLVGGIVLSAMVRWSKWLNFLAIPIVVLFFYLAYDTLAQPYIGQAIVKEQGKPYIYALYGSSIIVLTGVVIGNILGKWRSNA
jgi:hypothetical protein